MSTIVNADNFVTAETARMFHDLQRDAGGVNRFSHNRAPAAIDKQTVIRLNRDTLYSFAVVDVAQGATLSIPEHGDRYLSAMIVNASHHILDTFHDPGEYELHADRYGSSHVTIGVRTLVDPNDHADIAAVAQIQDGLSIDAASAHPFTLEEYDATSFDETRSALLALASRLTGFDRMFGTPAETEPVHHLIGTAAGWGGLPTREATYFGANPRVPQGRYELTVHDVPVDGFWSISVYNELGYFEPNPSDTYTVNNITAEKNADGSITVRFGDFPAGTPNVIHTPEKWNYLVRLYRPRTEILDGSWVFPSISAVPASD